ncbi:MAG: type II toxin-antitoxin system VapB family antitoxin [Candidatus Polarisedimenticolaceae bacterium]|nr:type II toxin-antitoxin system VapB family antitoxin [Candidatus Polarisedimenticolaceae bacterium]
MNIRNSETENLAAELAKLTGESKTRAVKKALVARLALLKQRNRNAQNLADELDEIANHCAGLPVLDSRNPEELLYKGNDFSQTDIKIYEY